MSNIWINAESSRVLKTYSNGLNNYVQENCQVSLTDNGFRIYRPPNLTVSEHGNTMWGGLKLRNRTSSGLGEWTDGVDNMWGLTQNHTYVVMFHVKGQSTNNATSWGWTNLMGWGGGGLSPSPTVLESVNIGSNFNGERDLYYKFKIEDIVKKTCTTTYSYATAGKDYLSYCDFMFGFGYESTGTLGTDLYLTNLRMYDITSGVSSPNLLTTGIIEVMDFNELEVTKLSISPRSSIITGSYIEY